MSINVNITVNIVINVSTDEVFRSLKLLEREEVLVGVPDTEAGRRDREINNAALAYIHDNGSPAQNIPARPFMRPGIEAARGRLEHRLLAAGKKAIAGKVDEAHKELEAVGLIAQSSIRTTINKGIPPPLKPKTLSARRRRGRSGTKPLIDTGQLRNSINYIVRRRK